MKVKEITVSKGFTLKMGNYEFARLDASMTVRLDDEDDPSEAYQMAASFVEEKLYEDMDALNDSDED